MHRRGKGAPVWPRQRAHLDGNAADGAHGLARKLLVDVIDVFGQLRGDLVRIGLVRNCRQDLQLQALDVAGLVRAAEECRVDLQQ